MTRYTTRTEAIEREILTALGEHAADHDVEAIAREVLGDYEQGFACIVDAPTFWAIVEHHARDTHPAVPHDVPTTERVRRTYAYGDSPTPQGFRAAGEAFDAWLAAHDAELLGRHGQGSTR